IEPALELRVTREGAAFLSEQGDDVLKGLLGEADGDWIDASEVINEFVGDLSLFGLSAEDVVAAVRLPNPGGLTIEFLDAPTRIHVEIDELHVRIEATVVDDGGRACRVRGDVQAGNDRRMFTLRNLEVDVGLDTAANGAFILDTTVLNVEIVDSGIQVVTDPNDPAYYCNLPQCTSCSG